MGRFFDVLAAAGLCVCFIVMIFVLFAVITVSSAIITLKRWWNGQAATTKTWDYYW